MRTVRETICCIFLLAISAAAATTGTNYTVKSGGGGNYTTIQACANAMAAGDTCTVFAGTYNEHPTIPAGAAGSPKTITVNGSDVVHVQGFSLGNYVNIIGNCAVGSALGTGGCFNISNTSSPGTSCISFGSNDQVSGNVMQSCGTIGIGSSHVFDILSNNTVSYQGGTPSSPNGTTCIQMNPGDNNNLIDGNDFSHCSDFLHFNGNHNVVRNNYFHDFPSSDCGSNSGNCHVDFIESEPGATTQDNVFEGNKEVNISGAGGANGHGFLFQGDICSGNCFHAIVRFNQLAHISGGGIIDDNAFSSPPAYTRIHSYNNTWADMVTSSGNRTGGSVNTFSHGSTNASSKNEIFYIVGSVSDFNTYSNDSSTIGTFSGGHSIAFCTGSPCTIHGANYGSGNWTDDPTNKLTNPLFVGYSSTLLGDLSLQPLSPAVNAGTYLTTVSGAVTNSTSLVVNDADYFQDGYGISGVQGDCIAVTAVSNHVCVSSVNYSTKTLTLTGPVSASNGDPVWLYSDSMGRTVLTGSAPNIGASVNASSQSVSPPTGLAAVVN